ncbi:serine/threonine-protein kinase ATM-like [Primulina eburnea]|uniref:serine/threonine-protein kinase ATM-like n=1 Tax=Primulina eburnea TaxID=1245227 RepID=UPI003C6C6381
MWLNHFSIMCGLSSKMFQVSNLSIVLSFAIFWKLHIIGFTCGNKFTPILYFCTWKRDEGKISCKLVECINTYLLKDEPNLGGKSLEIHQALNHFVFRYWFATHDRSLKCVLSELVDVMSKELDQMSTSSTNSPWGEKCGIMTSSQFKVAELGDLVFCQVCANTYKSPVTEKRARREHVVVLIKERVMGGKWPQIINAETLEHSYDDLFCTLQSLLRLSLSMLFAAPNEKSSKKLAFPLNEDNENKLHELSGPLYEVGKGWHVIWNCLMRSLPTFCNLTSIVEAAFMLLCSITSSVCFVFHLMLLLQENLVGDLQDFLYLRQNVLPAVLAILNLKEFTTLNERFVVLLPAAAYALSTGSTPLLMTLQDFCRCSMLEPVEELAKRKVQVIFWNAQLKFLRRLTLILVQRIREIPRFFSKLGES